MNVPEKVAAYALIIVSLAGLALMAPPFLSAVARLWSTLP